MNWKTGPYGYWRAFFLFSVNVFESQGIATISYPNLLTIVYCFQKPGTAYGLVRSMRNWQRPLSSALTGTTIPNEEKSHHFAIFLNKNDIPTWIFPISYGESVLDLAGRLAKSIGEMHNESFENLRQGIENTLKKNGLFLQ